MSLFTEAHSIMTRFVALSSFHHYGVMIPRNLCSFSLRRARPSSALRIQALNTFLPYSSFERSVQCLDKRRLGKQRVEAMQILNIISDEPPPVNRYVREEASLKETVSPAVEELLVLPWTAAPEEKKVKRQGWVNAPAVRMWRGHRDALALYYNACLLEWERRGCRNVLLHRMEISAGLAPTMPPWLDGILNWSWGTDLGNEAVHASHRSNLLRKEPEHYIQFGWTEPDSLPYVWPVPLVKASAGK